MRSQPSEVYYLDESADDLIRRAKEHPPEPIIRGLLNVGETLVIHGTEESFKSIFALQIAHCISKARTLLDIWRIPTARRVGVLDTEMHRAGLGQRLAKLLGDETQSENLSFLSEDAVKVWRTRRLTDKFDLLKTWITELDIRVLVVDTANDFFRGRDNPSDERVVGEFFDLLRSLPVDARILVRHDRKKKEHDGGAHSNELIRGSARWKEDPEVIAYLKRVDKRTHQVCLEIGKLRYGAKPEPMQLWFDADRFRLVSLPPVIAALERGARRTREEIVAHCEKAFGLSARTVDEMLKAEDDFLDESRDGHKRTFAVDLDRAKDKSAPWFNLYCGKAVCVAEKSKPGATEDAVIRYADT